MINIYIYILLNRFPNIFEYFCITIESRYQIPRIDFIKEKKISKKKREDTMDTRYNNDQYSDNHIISFITKYA